MSRVNTAGWEGPAMLIIYFSSGGCIEFARALVRLSQGEFVKVTGTYITGVYYRVDSGHIQSVNT